jgi:Icc-related predicted phosphoesterase
MVFIKFHIVTALAETFTLGQNTDGSPTLKILAISDMVVDRLYTTKVAEYFRDVELILSCGDLPYEYLEFLVTVMNVPLLYVPGNHDPEYDERNKDSLAQGGENIDLKIKSLKKLNIAGIGGSIRYRPDVPNQYSQYQMYTRITSFVPKLLWHLPRHGNQLDILMAHSPPRGIHDDDDAAHIGFSAFLSFIQTFKPRFFLHGHTAVYKNNIVSPITKVGETSVINVYPYRVIEL